MNGKLVGTIASSAIFSLCKGKNFSTYSGGFAAFQDEELAELYHIEQAKLPRGDGGWKMALILMAFALAMRPGVYGPLYPLIQGFKSTEVHQDFKVFQFTGIQAALGRILLPKLEIFNSQRRANGMFLYQELKGKPHILLPEIIAGAEPVFTHLPVVFLNENDRDRAQRKLWNKGIDTARMYLYPNHHIYDLGYRRDEFPNSKVIADGLVTLPTHSFLTQRDLEIMVEVVGGKN